MGYKVTKAANPNARITGILHNRLLTLFVGRKPGLFVKLIDYIAVVKG